MVDVESNILYVYDAQTPDTYFAVAHELRHVWQYKNHPDWFDNYKTSDKVSVYDYNIQRVEIDANAYAMIIMEDLYGLKPLFDGIPEKIIEIIEIRADKICEEEI